ncbi:MAG: site-specific integrase [Catenulispora sp.]|nr:site-specific integrase [Catenulispora sp.]NUR61439.1 site-specific integrase [Catenulispora sp.]
MAKNPVFKKCGCREPVIGPDGAPAIDAAGKPKMRRLGASCPQLRSESRWNPKHGTWHFQIEINMSPEPERHLGQGGIATETEAEAAVNKIRTLVAIADEHDDDPAAALRLRGDIVERIRAALKDRRELPSAEEIRQAAKLGIPIINKITVAEWLTEWLNGKGTIATSTRRSYAGHIDNYLIPHLGTVPLDKLRVAHLQAMFTTIAEDAEIIPAENAARHAMKQAAARAWEDSNPDAVRACREQLATMPPFRRAVQAASRQRLRATLRSALSAACKQQLITVNVAKLVELETGKRPKALVWNTARVARWRATGETPSPVMVWTAEQTGSFLEHAAEHPLFALYHLIAFTGLRRGEACGLRWVDLNLDTSTMTVAQQIVQNGWETEVSKPKTDAGERDVALDALTVGIIKAHRRTQATARLAHGPGWADTGLTFTNPDGTPLHPAHVTDQFTTLVAAADLPPIRLHDLRHGAASLALAAGIDIKVVSEMLGHSTTVITRDTYTSVYDELKHAAAASIAAAITGARKAGAR